MENAKYWIDQLKLLPHPEGGYFRETYRSEGVIDNSPLSAEFPSGRRFSTAIYYLLEGLQSSKFHRIKSDEMWHHYAGAAVLIHVIALDGKYSLLRLGKDLSNGEVCQLTVPAGAWFGAELEDKGSFALAGCTVSPGFEFRDFEMGLREGLMESFPEHKGIVERLT